MDEMSSLNKELIKACRYGKNFTLATELLQQGADPNARDDWWWYDKRTPLHWGCWYGGLQFVKLLIETYKCNPEVRDNYQQTPLHSACRFGHLNIVQYLISEQGCDPEVRDRYQRTPLHCAYLNNYVEIVKFLIRQQNFNPDHIINSDQQTLLHFACQDGHFNIVQYLISKRGCNPEVKDRYQRTSLHYACRHGHLNIVQYLSSERGCNPEVRDSDQRTPLHYACQNGHLNIVQYLISEQGCNVDVQDKSGDTPLHCASQYDRLKVIKVLFIKGKCNPDLTNNDGDTAIHSACRLGYITSSTVKYLLEEGNSNPNLKNKDEQTPLELTSDPDKIRALIRHGANPTNVYETHGKVVGAKQPLQPPVKVFVIGNPSAGKSTLTAALKIEKSLLARTFTLAKKVSGVDEKTAGVIPHDFISKKSGPITLYDFAGQPEFYSSHAALLQNAIQTSPPIFLLVVDLCESDEEMKQTILYWLSFLENQCTSVSSKSHVIVVGSHVDILRARGEDPKQKSSVIDSLQKSHQFSNLDLSVFIVLDCQYSESTGMSELRECLKKSCDSLRNQETLNFNSHCFLVYLLDKFRDTTAVTINKLHVTLSEMTINFTDELFYFLPTYPSALCSLCDELNDRGHILFLKDPVSIENSWVIIDKTALLSEVTGTIFAPENFKQHCKLASSTGVVPVSNLAKTFPQHNVEMLVSFLSHLEFCHEITDQEVLQLASEQHQTTSEEATCSPSDCYLLFPALTSLDVPSKLWEPNPEFKYHCGWIMQCCKSDQFFTSRFVQVLLLRLAFIFAFPHNQDFPALLRKCSLWKNGIYWGNRDGVETLVEVVEQNKAVIVLMRYPELTSEYLQLRSSVIQKVLAAANEFCGKVNTMESFIDPSEIIKYSLKPSSQLTLFSLTEIAEAVINAKPAVVSATGRTMSLDKLGLGVDKDKLSIFAGRNPEDLVSSPQSHTRRTQPHSGQLTLNDVGSVRKAIWKSRVKWYDLGIELGVSVDTLKVIKADSHHEVDDCFTGMLQEWLKTNPTWSSLVEALKSPPVDYPQLAEEVFTNYVNTTSTPDN